MGKLVSGRAEDKEYLCSLWQQVFGDSVDYIKCFFGYYFQDENVYIWKEKDEITTVLYALPAEIRIPGFQILKAYYLYAIATVPKYRGNHYLEQMLPALKEKLGEDSILFLVPEKEVIPYYESLGFMCRCAAPGRKAESRTENDIEYSPGNNVENRAETQTETGIEILPLRDPVIYKKLRDQAFADSAYVAWDEHEIAYAMEEIRESGGEVYLIRSREKEELSDGYMEKEYLLAGYIEKEYLFHAVETTLPTNLQDKVLEKLHCAGFLTDELIYMTDTELDTNLYLSLALN
ncbi:MAG: GNAT family N-acetyltransferase [Lachnospiraceae bacterium]